MKIGRKREKPNQPQPDQPQREGSEQASPVPSAQVPAMLPSSPLAPFTPAVLAHVPEPEPEPRSDEPVEPDLNPMAPMAPVAVVTQGKCCGDVDGGGGGGQTPWMSNIDAAGFSLLNTFQISSSNNTLTLQSQIAGIDINGNPSVSIRTEGTMSINSSEQIRIDSQVLRINAPIGLLKNPGNSLLSISVDDLPTSSAGLLRGDIWNNAGVLNIVL